MAASMTLALAYTARVLDRRLLGASVWQAHATRVAASRGSLSRRVRARPCRICLRIRPASTVRVTFTAYTERVERYLRVVHQISQRSAPHNRPWQLSERTTIASLPM